MTMRIAIAGGGGFAYILAREISQTANSVLVLSTQQHPEFDELGVQVAIVDYANYENLRYVIRGVDTVLSTITGEAQLNLIHAARFARVHTFVPSEFEGALENRPHTGDLLDRGSSGAALQLLNECAQSTATTRPMRYTVFSCGIFYERFQPGGLGTTLNIGLGSSAATPGSYLVNADTARAEVVHETAQGQPIVISMTSMYDVARFVAAAIEIGPERWPRELRMRGDQLTVQDIVQACSDARGVQFNVTNHEYCNLQAHIDWAFAHGEFHHWNYFIQLLATADGRFTYSHANLNEIIDHTAGVDVRPVRFADWARQVWAVPPATATVVHQTQQQQQQQQVEPQPAAESRADVVMGGLCY